MTTPIECKGRDCQKDGCEVGDTSKGFTTYSFMIRNASQFEVRECFTVYRPLSRSNQALPVFGTVQRLSSNGLKMTEFRKPEDAINRAAEKYGFARILLSTCNRGCNGRKPWNGGNLIRSYVLQVKNSQQCFNKLLIVNNLYRNVKLWKGPH